MSSAKTYRHGFRSDLGLYVHLHCLVTDGAYEEQNDGELRFLAAPPPTPERAQPGATQKGAIKETSLAGSTMHSASFGTATNRLLSLVHGPADGRGGGVAGGPRAAVLPAVGHQQWVLSFPGPMAVRLGYDAPPGPDLRARMRPAAT